MTRRNSSTAWAISASLAGLLVLSTLPAFAQSSAGVRSGRFRVHPEARVEGRFDSNLYREDTVEESPTQVGYLRLMPSLRVTNPHPGQVALDGSLGLELRQYLDSTVNDQQDAVGVNLAVGGTLGQGKAFSLSINEDLRRQLEAGQGFNVAGAEETGAGDDPPADVDAVGCASPCTLSFWRNTTRVQARIAPGGGRLVFAPSYRLSILRYEEFDTIDKDTHELRLGGSYRFFPRTSMVFDTSYSFINYTDEQQTAEVTPFRVKGGLRGLITTKLATTLTVGYGNAFASTGDNFSSVIALVEMIYALSPGLRARVSYNRDFGDSAFANVVTTNRVGGKLQAALGGDFNASADVYASFRSYSQGFIEPGVEAQVDAAELAGRDDTFLVGNLAGSYHPNEWLVVTGGYRLEQNITSYGVRIGGVENFAAFARHQIFLGAGLLL